MARTSRSNVSFPSLIGRMLPTLGGVLLGLGVAGLVAFLPDWRLQDLVEASGLPQLLPIAQPPLGQTARILVAVGAGVLAGAVAWSALFLLVGPGGLLVPRRRGDEDAPMVRRADAHPDAPPRRPLSAAELGAPMPPAEPLIPEPLIPEHLADAPIPAAWHPAAAAADVRDLPADLEQPLAAFDPAAIPAVPREPVRAVRPVTPPVVAPAAADPLPGIDRPSIESLLDRLERGTRRSVAP